jgi:putative transcription factor
MSKNFDSIVQDFQPVILKNQNARTKLKAQRDGKTESQNKHTMTDEQIRAAKIDRDTESTKVDTVSNELKTLIIKGRNAKGLTQKGLAAKVNMKPADIQLYENGKAIPNQAEIQKLQKALGVKLTGLKNKKN